MAGGAVIHDTGVIKHAGGERAGLVTDTAILGGGHMIHRFTDGGCAMARGTVTHDTGMIKHRTNKGGGVMTDATILGGGNVRTRFRGGVGIRAIMAAGAIAADALVTEDRGPECRGGMAEITILGRGQMVGGRILANRKLPVMTTVTAIGHPGVVKHAGGKTAGDMAHRAILGGRNMIHRLAGG